MFGNFGQIAEMIKNAGKIREQMAKAAEEAGKLRITGEAGGGEVVATVDGHFNLVAIRVDPKLLARGDQELLEEMIVAAVGRATAKAREEVGRSFSEMAEGMPIPDLSRLMGGPKG